MKLDKDFQDLLFVFNANNVKYLVVGGFAFSFHAESRRESYVRSAHRILQALYRPVGCFRETTRSRCRSLSFRAADGKTFFQLGVPPNRVDVMQTIEAVEFNQAWARHSEGRTEDGVPFYVISREDLIVNKSAVGRARDLADVERLRK